MGAGTGLGAGGCGAGGAGRSGGLGFGPGLYGGQLLSPSATLAETNTPVTAIAQRITVDAWQIMSRF